MSSLVLALIVALLASAVPLAVFGLDREMAALVLVFTLLLWPLVALFRQLVGWLYEALTRRRAP